MDSSTNAQVSVAGLVVGRHTFTAVLAVNGPTVTAGVVGAVAARRPFALQLRTYGVTIANIAADTNGRTAHYVVSIDGAMPRAGVVLTAGPGGARCRARC